MAGSYNLGTAEGRIRITYDGKGAKQSQEDMDKTNLKAKQSSASMQDVGNKAGLAGAAIAAGLGVAVGKAISFEKQISAIGAVTGASSADLDAFRKKALQLGADTSFSAAEAAQAMEELAKAGVSLPDILNGAADATTALAAAGGVALPDAAALMSNAMNAFGLTAKELPAIVDQIAGAANASAIDVGDFGNSLSQVGAVAHLAGLSFQDTAVAIAEMGNAGIKGSDAGTSLKTFLQNLIPTTKQQTELFKDLGIVTKDGANQFFDAQGKLKSFSDIQQILATSLKGMSKEQKLATLQTAFGSDAIRAAAVFADQGAAGFDKMAAAIGKTKAADVAAARLDNAAGRLEQLKGSAETAAIAFGSLLLPALDSIVKGLTTFANFLAGLSSGWKTAIVSILGFVAGILLLVATILKIIQIVKAFQVVWIALNASFLFSPIGLIIIAIVALVAAIAILWIKSSAFRDFWIKIWNWIKDAALAVGHWFAGPFTDFFKSAWEWLKTAAMNVWEVMKSVWNGIVSVVQAVWAPIKAVIDFIVAGFQFWWGVIQGILNFFAPLFRAVFGAVIAVVQLWWSVVSAIFTVAWTFIKTAFQTGMDFIINGWRIAWGIVSAVVSAVWAVIGPFVMGAINLIKDGVLTAVRLLQKGWELAWNAVKTVISTVWGWIGPYVMTAFNLIKNGILNFINIIKVGWSTGWNLVKSVFTNVWNAIQSFIQGAISRITAIFNGIKAIVDKVKGFFNQLKAAASGGVGSLIDFVKGIPGRIIGALGNVASMLFSSGRKIIQGLIDGILNMAGNVGDAIGSVLQKARNLLPFSPAKEGPFSGRGWTLYSGQSIMEAMAAGIEAKGGDPKDAMLLVLKQMNSLAVTNNPANTGAFTANGNSLSGFILPPSAPAAPPILGDNYFVVDLGDGVQHVVKATITKNPDLIAKANAEGTQRRTFLSPGRS
jgi:TP901 family phage tail tape measure protein